MRNVACSFAWESSGKIKGKSVTHPGAGEKKHSPKWKQVQKMSSQKPLPANYKFQSNYTKLATDVWWEHIIGLKIVLTVAA